MKPPLRQYHFPPPVVSSTGLHLRQTSHCVQLSVSTKTARTARTASNKEKQNNKKNEENEENEEDEDNEHKKDDKKNKKNKTARTTTNNKDEHGPGSSCRSGRPRSPAPSR